MHPTAPTPALVRARRSLNVLSVLAVFTLCTLSSAAPARAADERLLVNPSDVLSLDAAVTTEVSPDLAIINLAIDREGPDPVVLSREINQVLTDALARARAISGVIAASGGYTSYPRQDNRGKRTGWQVRAELILKSKDFARLSQLAGALGNDLQVSGTRFEVSPELRGAEEARLIDSAAQAFRNKATAAVKAFGFAGYRIREVQLGSLGQQAGPRPVLMAMSRAGGADAAGPPLESGRVTLTLTVSGSVQMQR